MNDQESLWRAVMKKLSSQGKVDEGKAKRDAEEFLKAWNACRPSVDLKGDLTIVGLPASSVPMDFKAAWECLGDEDLWKEPKLIPASHFNKKDKNVKGN